MYYVKTTFKHDGLETEIKQEICDGKSGNIYTRCHDCGKELHVSLKEVFSEGIDLQNTYMVCKECNIKRLSAEENYKKIGYCTPEVEAYRRIYNETHNPEDNPFHCIVCESHMCESYICEK